MRLDVAVLGASGYGGGELLRLLTGHPAVASLRGTSTRLAGRPWHAAHPNLRGVADGAFEAAINWCDLASSLHPVVFSAMPHGALAGRLDTLEKEWARAGLADRLTLVDLSGDFRLRSAEALGQQPGKAHDGQSGNEDRAAGDERGPLPARPQGSGRAWTVPFMLGWIVHRK